MENAATPSITCTSIPSTQLQAMVPFNLILFHIPPPPPGCLYGYTYGQQTVILPPIPISADQEPLQAVISQSAGPFNNQAQATTSMTNGKLNLVCTGALPSDNISNAKASSSTFLTGIGTCISGPANTVELPINGNTMVPCSPATTFKPFDHAGSCHARVTPSSTGFATPSSTHDVKLSAGSSSFETVSCRLSTGHSCSTNSDAAETGSTLSSSLHPFWGTPKTSGFPRMPQAPAAENTEKCEQQENDRCQSSIALTLDDAIKQNKRAVKSLSFNDTKFLRTNSRLNSVSLAKESGSCSSSSAGADSPSSTQLKAQPDRIKGYVWRVREKASVVPEDIASSDGASEASNHEACNLTKIMRSFSFGCRV